MPKDLLQLESAELDQLRQLLAPLYDKVDQLCDDRGMDRPPRF